MHHGHDIGLVVISVLVSLLGSFTGLTLASRLQTSSGAERRAWLASAAVALGGGAIWSMHFVAMLAFHLGTLPITFDVPLTLLSLVLAIAFTGLGLALVTHWGTRPRPLIISGLAMGAGVASMHYTGMAALHTEARISYDPVLVATSLTIAVVASTAALWLTTHARVFATRMAAAGVMAFAVSAMHYTAMAAARFAPLTSQHRAGVATSSAYDPSQPALASAVIVATLVVLCLGIAASYVDQRRAEKTRRAAAELAAANERLANEIEIRRRVQANLEVAQNELADQRFERLADSMSTALLCTDQEGRITSWNRAAETIFGYTESEVIGQQTSICIPQSSRPYYSEHGVSRRSELAGKTFEALAVRKNGQEFPVEISLSTWTEDGGPAFGAIVNDITDRVQAHERLQALAYRDQLTGLPNRQAFADAIRALIGSGERRSATLLLLDLDGFKEVNDSRGHSCGDIVLMACATRLLNGVPEDATVSRLGGDEFAILLSANADAATCADRILHSFEEPIHAGGRPFHLGTSIGIVRYPEHATDMEELLVNADLALYRAKSLGGNRREFFSPALAEELQVRRKMEADLLRAYTRGEFELLYQPLIRLSDAEVIGAEALLRWRHRERGLLGPEIFLSTLETISLAEVIGNWVLQTACAQGAIWHSGGHSLRIGVNLFAAQFHSGNLEDKVAHALAHSGLPAELLELEITENIALANDESMVAPLKALRGLGVSIAFDDFGTGFGSMSMLKRFPITRLKIDRSFVHDITTSKDDLGIVRAVLALGKSLDIKVIAEGVEDSEQLTLLSQLGCSEGQGYLFGKPMSAAQFETAFLQEPSRQASVG